MRDVFAPGLLKILAIVSSVSVNRLVIMNPQAFSTFPFGRRTKTVHSPPAVCPLQSSVYYYLFKVSVKVCVSVCFFCVVHVHAGVAPFAILSVFSLCTVGIHLLFWLAGLPACIRLPRSRCQTHFSKSFNLPCIYKCSHLARGSIHCSLGSQSDHCPVHQSDGSPVWSQNMLHMCLTIIIFNTRYTPFEDRTGASTVPTSCGASSPRVFAAQVIIHSNINIACHGLHIKSHINHGLHNCVLAVDNSVMSCYHV